MSAPLRSLTDLIGSRICHDLISPIGAISNGVELMSMGNGSAGPELELISESVDNANAKIRYFRIAFGAARIGQLIGRTEIVSILRDTTHNARLTVNWQPGGELERTQVKLAFLLLMCFETAMPWGGQIAINSVGGQWALNGQADQLKVDADLWAALNNPDAMSGGEPATVHFPMASLAAQELGRKLRVESSANKLRVRF